MPTYLAKCPKCLKELEYFAYIKDRELTVPICNICKIKMEPAWVKNVGGFILKGQGWYAPGGHK